MSGQSEQRPNLENAIQTRWWELIKNSWMGNLPQFAVPGLTPSSGFQDLAGLQRVATPNVRSSFTDDDASVRSCLLAEAVFLFHKCAHAHLAAQRLGSRGMHSWCMFNAYHSAFLGARGVMAMLGIGLAQVQSRQYLLDAFPQPSGKKDKQRLAAGKWEFSAYELVHFQGPPFKQEEIWDAFCRTVRVAVVPCWSGRAYDELRKLSNKAITKPRNAFLYTPAHWPLGDLLADAADIEFLRLFGSELSQREQGFLLRLSCDVYALFQSLMSDLAELSEPIRLELEASRIVKSPDAPELVTYNLFVQNVAILNEATQ